MTLYFIEKSCQIPTLPEIYQANFGDKVDGTFVEIGSHDGRMWSNTWCLAELGWHGLYVDASIELAAMCKINHAAHPAVRVTCAIVGRHGEEKTLYHTDDNDVAPMLTSDKAFADAVKSKGVYANGKAVSLDDLIERYYADRPIDLVVIDVDGGEMEVLEGFTLQRWLPTMVIIEAHEKNPVAYLNKNAAAINAYFTEYDKVYSDHVNNIYVRKV